VKLEEIVNFFSGPNSIELKKKYNKYVTYTNEDLEFDLYQGYRTDEIKRQKSPILNAGDLVINMMTNQTAIVSPHSAGKVIPQHIVKLNFMDRGDNWYLCYLLNEAQTIKRQLYNTMEGTALRRVTLTSFKQLEVKLPVLAKQQKIGELYRLLLIKEGLQKKQQEKEKQVIINLIDKNDINGG
jgi:restriction endonuclease S subunit